MAEDGREREGETEREREAHGRRIRLFLTRRKRSLAGLKVLPDNLCGRTSSNSPRKDRINAPPRISVTLELRMQLNFNWRNRGCLPMETDPNDANRRPREGDSAEVSRPANVIPDSLRIVIIGYRDSASGLTGITTFSPLFLSLLYSFPIR